MLLLPPLQRVDWDRVEQYMLHEEFESTTKVTRQEDKPKPGTGRDQDQGPEPGEKKPPHTITRTEELQVQQTSSGGTDQN